jgi:hypothetical protein
MNVEDYLLKTKELLKAKKYTDGCTTPFKTYIHRWLTCARLLCAAHDFGSLGLITGVRPGWHNNWMTWKAHLSQSNPVYWIWGTVVALVTLPWVFWRRNLGIAILDMAGFHVILLAGITLTLLIIYQPT